MYGITGNCWSTDFTCFPVDIQSIDWDDDNFTASPIFYIMLKIRKMGLPGIEKFTRLCKKIGNKRTPEELLKEGRQEKDRENALKMLKKGIDIATVCECTDLSREEVEELRNGTKAA